MKIKRIIEVEEELKITGATLLSTEEAEKLPIRLRKYNTWWWLRSKGGNRSRAAIVCDDGLVYYYGFYIIHAFNCVRPALIFSKTESSNLTIGDCFIFDDKEFEIISDNLAFCKSDIGLCCFRHDHGASDANIYETSDVKQFVDDWFRNAMSSNNESNWED